MISNVVFSKTVDGVWISTQDGGELCIYTEDPRGVVIGKYKEKNKTPIETAVMFNPDGMVILQEEDAGSFQFTNLDPVKVAVVLEDFLKELKTCRL